MACFSFVLAQSAVSNELFSQGVDFYNKGDYAKAIPVFEKMMQLDNRELAETSLRRGYGESWLAACYYKMGNEEKARELSPDSYRTQPVDRRLTVESDRLCEQGMFFFSSGNFEKALHYFRQCANFERKMFPTHVFYANTLSLMAHCMTALDSISEAKPLLKECCDILKKNNFSVGYYGCMSRLGQCYRLSMELDNASKCIEEAQQGYIALGDTVSFDYLMILYESAGISFLKGIPDVYQKATELRMRFEKGDFILTPEYLDVVHLCVLTGHQQGKISESQIVDDENLIMRMAKENIGTDCDYYVRSLQYLGSYYFHHNNKEKARDLAEEAFALVENSKNLSPNTTALIYKLMGEIHSDSMAVEKAIAMYDKAYYFYNAYQIPVDAEYLHLLRDMSMLYSSTDRPDAAVNIGEQFLAIYKTNKWPIDMNYIMVLLSLQQVYDLMGNTQRRSEMVLEMKKAFIDNPSLPRNSYPYMRTLQSEAYIAMAEGNFDLAKADAEEMISVDEGADSDLRSIYVMAGNVILAQCYIKQGDSEHGLQYLQNLNDIYPQGDSNKLSKAMSNMLNSMIKASNNDFAAALSQAKLALSQYDDVKSVLGDNNEIRLTFLNAITTYAYQLEDRIAIVDAVAEQNAYFRNFIRSHFLTMTYRERCDFWGKHSDWFNAQLPNVTFNMANDTLMCEAYNSLLLSKGLLLNSEIELKRLIDESNDKEMKELYTRFNQHKVLLANLHSATTTIMERDSLSEAIYREEKEVMQKLSSSFGDYTSRLDITWNQVCQSLHHGEAAIEFMMSPLSADSVVYSALVLRQGYKNPHLVRLFTEIELQSINDNLLYGSDDALRLIWQPLTKELEGVKCVYFSPIGQLYNIGIENLPMDGKTIGLKYDLYRLSSTREIVLRHKKNAKNSAVLYGGIDYSADSSTIRKTNLSLDRVHTSGNKQRNVSRWAVADEVASLPGTKVEVEQIGALLKKNGIVSQIYTEEAATEESIKAQSGQSPTWLHIATHGFFWSESQKYQYDNMTSLQQSMLLSLMGENSRVAQEDLVMNCTGLLFAGADRFLSGNEVLANIDDGILTSYEISRLDFLGTDIVTLSACETAKGNITSDGVFGLQRGFKKAGANSILMSLWKVDDEATCLFMTEFYRNWIGEKMTKHDALEAAKQKVRSHRERGWDDPKYWAAFILLDGLD